jgi:multisubunit Na+/H+ antiporter MnhG subunit
VRTAVVDALLIAGLLLALLSCAGVVVMRDAISRVHYTGPLTLAVGCLSAAVVVQGGLSQIALRAFLLAAFVLVTAPVIAHGTARTVHIEEQRGEDT